jgi:cell division protein FtsZ
LVNITGGSDLTLFEVDEAVNKIRAEVDPEAELIFGSIEDEKLNGKIRVSIVATALDGQEPDTKPVVSMVHRLHNRNTGYSENSLNTLSANQSTLTATQGATALNLDDFVDENNIVQQKSEQKEIENGVTNDTSLENISIENATYLQSTENISSDKDSEPDENKETFEVDSIELATPELFSDKSNKTENNSFNQDNNSEIELKIFESSNSEKETVTKEPEMFKESNLEEDFEIPAFLRRQKN